MLLFPSENLIELYALFKYEIVRQISSLNFNIVYLCFMHRLKFIKILKNLFMLPSVESTVLEFFSDWL